MNILLISLAVASLSMTITRSKLFQSVREKVNFKLLNCPYCLSHWFAVIFVGLYLVLNGSMFNNNFIFAWIIISFAVVTLSSLFSIGIDIFMKRVDNE